VIGAVPYPIPGFSDPVSSLTHLVGAGVFACLAVFLLWRGRGNPARLISLGVYAVSTVLLLSLSGVYHLLSPNTGGRTVLQRLDHDAIFVLIAGTFTPMHIILFRGPWRWAPLLFVWTAAVTGVTLKSIFFTSLPEWLGLVLYLSMGWFGAVSGTVLWSRHGWTFIRPLLWGGVAYSIGGLLEFLQWPTLIPGVVGPHDLFHVGVLVGAGLHWKFVAQFAHGILPPLRTRPSVALPCP
jgi:channel protein (hemolysin III family)